VPLAQPGCEVCRTLKIKERISQCLQIGQGQCLDASLLVRGQGAAAALELAQGHGNGFRLPAFLTTLLLPLLQAAPKDFLVGDAVGEIVEGDPAHGANVGDGTAVEP